MKTLAGFLVLFFVPTLLFGTTRIVDRNHPVTGLYYSTIQAAINSSATNGDTILVLPGYYLEALTINKMVVIMGSGFETTIVSSFNSPTINMTNGKIMWLDIKSEAGIGISLTAGIVTNCVIQGCVGTGIYLPTSSTGIVANCSILMNGGDGVNAGGSGSGSVVNTISYFNAGNGFNNNNSISCYYVRNFCNGSVYYASCGTGNINADPLFVNRNSHPADLHIPNTSPCFDTGQPGPSDPDGSRQDMGYFGGPECPVFPIVKAMKMNVNGGNVTIDVTGKANY